MYDLIRSLRELALALGAVYDGSVADLRMVARGVPPTPHPHRSSPTRLTDVRRTRSAVPDEHLKQSELAGGAGSKQLSRYRAIHQ